VENLWERVQYGANKTASASLLDDALGDKAQQEAWRTLLGNDKLGALQELAEMVRNSGFAAETYKGAGRLSGSSIMNRLFAQGEVSALPGIAARMLIGIAYTGPLQKSITNLLATQEAPRLIASLVYSRPFIEEAVSRYGTDGARQIMGFFKDELKPLEQKELFIEGKTQNGDPDSLSPDEFKRWLERAAQQ
jgi:hypothetical protein